VLASKNTNFEEKRYNENIDKDKDPDTVRTSNANPNRNELLSLP
jgi:hypothetical protein